jgi:hypothetical protein
MYIERRFSPGRVEVRANGEGSAPTIRGHAAVYRQWYVMYDSPDLMIRETIAPGAFDNALRENQDVRALFNHDPSLILGRTKAGTLRLSLDQTGLVYEVDPPDTQAGRDVMTSLRRGDVDGSSFGFTLRNGGYVITHRDDANGKRIVDRELRDLNIFDVSPVTYPAYVGTDSEARSLGGLGDFIESIKEENRNRLKARAAEAARGRRLRLSQSLVLNPD